MPIDQARLNDCVAHGARFLARVLTPRVEGMRIVEVEGYRRIYLDNLFQPECPLLISTQNCEITVEFGEAHIHCSSDNQDLSEDQLVGQLVEKVVRVVGGVDLSFSAWSGNRCLGFGWLKENEGGRRLIQSFPLANRFKVTGWVLEDNLEILRDPQLGLGKTEAGASH